MISEWYGMNGLESQLSPRSTTPSIAMEPVPSDFRILFQRSLLKLQHLPLTATTTDCDTENIDDKSWLELALTLWDT